MSVTIRDDPRLRSDGRCAQCGGERRGPSPRAHKQYVDAGHYELDPFCSAECCKEWHGCGLESSTRGAGSLGYEMPKPIRLHGTEAMYGRGKCRCDTCREAASRGRKERRQRSGK